MKNYIFKVTIVIACLFITSCATYYSEAPQSNPHASIKSLTRDKIFNPPLVGILEINGLPVDNFWKGYGAKRRIPSGPNSIYVTAYTNSPLTAYSLIEFDAEPEIEYTITYESSASKIIFILSKETTDEEIVKVEAEKVAAPTNNDVFIPIFIPQ